MKKDEKDRLIFTSYEEAATMKRKFERMIERAPKVKILMFLTPLVWVAGQVIGEVIIEEWFYDHSYFDPEFLLFFIVAGISFALYYSIGGWDAIKIVLKPSLVSGGGALGVLLIAGPVGFAVSLIAVALLFGAAAFLPILFYRKLLKAAKENISYAQEYMAMEEAKLMQKNAELAPVKALIESMTQKEER